MARHHTSTYQAPAHAGRHDTSLILDAFVSNVYLPHAKLRKRSWRMDERIARQYLSPVFGHRRLAGIQRHEVEDWLHGLSVSGLTHATCNRILAVFKTSCSLAERRGILSIGQSPCAGVPSFKIHMQRERYLTRDEAQRLMRALEKSDRPEAFALRLLLLTGARKSEILKARWEHIRLDLRLLIVPLSKSGKPRHILLSDAALGVLHAMPLTDASVSAPVPPVVQTAIYPLLGPDLTCPKDQEWSGCGCAVRTPAVADKIQTPLHPGRETQADIPTGTGIFLALRQAQ